MQSPEGLGNTFGRAWELLSSNWIMLVPGLVIGIVVFVINFFLIGAGVIGGAGLGAAGATGMGLSAFGMAAVLATIVGLVGVILTIAYTTGMAGAAWSTGRATLDDGAAAFRKDAGSILVAVILLVVLAIVASFLSVILFFTLGLPLLLFVLFFLYTFASVIIGGRSGSEALMDSARVATRNFLTTLLLLVLLCVVFLIAGLIDRALVQIPMLGGIIAVLIKQIVAVYATLVIVGEYIKLSRTSAVMAAPPSAGPPATY
jgi:hypothetical protein